ncbi:bcl-2-modifying factor isoform X3 [Excalfactoria chinensis]|uniref:bcl-2-modifying factor isoform X3 n=1 Tax=Excalfactoria chinensis TaxID=46218 RepID=UPI003B3A5F9E
MDRPSYLEEDYSSLDGLDDDVFHSDDFGLAGQPGEMTATGIFTQNQSYSCLLGRFQLFPLTHCCGPGVRHPEQQDKATQTLSPSSSSQDVMLPCGVTEEPRRLFYGTRHLLIASAVLDTSTFFSFSLYSVTLFCCQAFKCSPSVIPYHLPTFFLNLLCYSST